MIGLAVGAVLLAGAVAYFLFGRGGGDEGQQIVEQPVETTAVNPLETTAPETTTTETVAGPETAEKPQVAFDQAAVGPINADEPYTISIVGGPADGMLQLLIDGAPAAEPAPELAPVTFTPGRHLLEVKVTSATAGEVSTTPVLVYAVDAGPSEVTYRANLASVNVDPNIEGWAEAVRRFDEFVANGHTDLKLMPSDRYPSLTPGYWNLFVDGFGSASEAEAYCEAAGLAVPLDCFPVRIDPNG